MNGLLLSARPELETNRRLVEGARCEGISLRVVDGTRVVAATGGVAGLWLGDENLLTASPRLLLARVGNWRPESLLAAVEVAAAAGVITPNPAAAIRRARDHWRSLEVLAGARLPVPETAVAADPEALATYACRLGFPVVVKLRRSRMGVGVILCRGRDHLESVLDSLWRLGDEVLVQRHLAAGSSSLRFLVVGDQVVAAARFTAGEGEWRSNSARGGSAESYQPSDLEITLAVAAAQALDLGVCGVDLLVEGSATMVCEVNPTPGFRSLEKATGVDVARAIVRHAAALCRPQR